MYCTKCGKEIRSGDLYCGACGSKLGAVPVNNGAQKKGNSWMLILVCAVVLILAAGKLFGGTPAGSDEPVQQQGTPVMPSVQTQTVDTLPEVPEDGDILEESDYSDGSPRRRISDYGDKYITDYRPDGTVLRETTLYYNGDTYGGKRVSNCDEHGNPTDELEIMPDGTLWLYMFYINSYDEQGRPLALNQYNRKSYPLCSYEYTYNADGSYSMVCTEYRGPVYEYDFEENPSGTTNLWFQSITTFTSAGDVVDQLITISDGVETEY